jgi:hypothetical protein
MEARRASKSKGKSISNDAIYTLYCKIVTLVLKKNMLTNCYLDSEVG